MILFRLGKTLMLGEALGDRVRVEGTLHNGQISPMNGCLMTVPSAFVINPSRYVNSDIFETREKGSVIETIHKEILPFIVSGREYEMEGSTLVAYQKHGDGVGFLSEGTVAWFALPDVLSHPRFGQSIALESRRGWLQDRRLIDPTSTIKIENATTVLERPLHAYMKTDPFRDITKIHEGTAVNFTGYYKGCIVMEADGEELWIPCEERSEYLPSEKDDWYYFNQDADNDNVPDPLEMLPSKAGLVQTFPASQEDNWNVTPHLPQSAGHFSPMPNIKMQEAGVLGGEDDLMEFLGTQGYEEFERHGSPGLHDLVAEPGLKPEIADEEEFEDEEAHREYLTSRDFETTDVSTVDSDYEGEEGDDSRMFENVLNYVIEGVSLDELLQASVDPKQAEALFKEQLRRAFGDEYDDGPSP